MRVKLYHVILFLLNHAIIPKSFYCYEGNIKCPYYDLEERYSKEFDETYPCGICKLYNTDDDKLWDEEQRHEMLFDRVRLFECEVDYGCTEYER